MLKTLVFLLLSGLQLLHFPVTATSFHKAEIRTSIDSLYDFTLEDTRLGERYDEKMAPRPPVAQEVGLHQKTSQKSFTTYSLKTSPSRSALKKKGDKRKDVLLFSDNQSRRPNRLQRAIRLLLRERQDMIAGMPLFY